MYKAFHQKLSKATKKPVAYFYNYLDEYLAELEDIFIAEQRLEKLNENNSSLVSLDEMQEKYGL